MVQLDGTIWYRWLSLQWSLILTLFLITTMTRNIQDVDALGCIPVVCPSASIGTGGGSGRHSQHQQPHSSQQHRAHHHQHATNRIVGCSPHDGICGNYRALRRNNQLVEAVDLACPAGEPVHAPFPGRVSFYRPFGDAVGSAVLDVDGDSRAMGANNNSPDGEDGPDMGPCRANNLGVRIDGIGQWQGYYMLMSAVRLFKYGGSVRAGQQIGVAASLDACQQQDRLLEAAAVAQGDDDGDSRTGNRNRIGSGARQNPLHFDNFVRFQLFRRGRPVDPTSQLIDCMCTGQICETNVQNRLVGGAFRFDSRFGGVGTGGVRGWELECMDRPRDPATGYHHYGSESADETDKDYDGEADPDNNGEQQKWQRTDIYKLEDNNDGRDPDFESDDDEDLMEDQGRDGSEGLGGPAAGGSGSERMRNRNRRLWRRRRAMAPKIYSPIDGTSIGRVRVEYALDGGTGTGGGYFGCSNEAIVIQGADKWIDYEVRIYNTRFRDDLQLGRQRIDQGQHIGYRLACGGDDSDDDGENTSRQSVFLEVRFQGVLVDISQALNATNCQHAIGSGGFASIGHMAGQGGAFGHGLLLFDP